MAQFIVRAAAHTKDGSALGGEMIVVTAPSAEAAKIQGANDLRRPLEDVIVEPLPPW